MGDFQLNFFFNLGRHMDSDGNARREDTLKQADEKSSANPESMVRPLATQLRA
jgi:hypothetical protein